MQLFADVPQSDRQTFTGEYQAFNSTQVGEIDAKVYFKLNIGEVEDYYDDFGGSLGNQQCQQFAAASDNQNLRVDSSEGVARIELRVGTSWKSYYPE